MKVRFVLFSKMAARKILVLFLLVLIVSLSASSVSPAFASPHINDGRQEGGPENAGDLLVGTFKKLAQLFISVAYSIMFILFAIGAVRTGLVANAAQQFGATGRVSVEMMNFMGGIAIFAFGLMTLPLVNWIIGEVSNLVPSKYDILIPGG